MKQDEESYWNPYLCGVLLGIVLYISFLVTGHGLGASGGLKFLMAADEETALRAFRQLARVGAKQVYILAGGIPAWLELFANTSSGTPTLLAGAFGGRHSASYPDVEHMALPKFEAKVKLGASGAKKAAGGCGG